MNDKPLYNSRIIDTYIKFIKRHYSYVNIGDLLDYAKMKAYEVADQGHWFTQEQIDLFYEKLVKITGNEKIAREAGRYAASPDALGVMRQYALGLVGPSSAFALLKQATANFVKSSTYESRKLASDKVEITVTPKEGIEEKLFQCENRIGFFEAIVMMFNYKLHNIQHTECIFKGGKVCRYVIEWENTASAVWKKIRNTVIALTIIAYLVLFIFLQDYLSITFLAISASIVLLISIISENREKRDLNVAIDNVRNSTNELLDQITVNYNNTIVTNEIGQAISRQTNIDDIISNVIQILEKRLDYDRGLILLANHEKTRLVFRSGFGYTEEQSATLHKTLFHLDRPESKGVFVISFRGQKPFLINDFNDIESNLSQHSLAFAKKMGTQSFICCPIICDEESIGILAVDNVRSKKPLIQSDMSLLMGIAHVIGISIRNADLLEARVTQFKSMLQALAASIDARDNLTAGHSAKVTEFSIGICEELGMTAEYREMIRVASLLHDYGKIGVPDAILKKPGRLTTEEHDIVKTHSAKTREILEQINFEGIYREVPQIAGSHHEKIDGTGYPNGLKGKEIPLGAKIIAVADFFEAITSKRHYRDPMPLDVALQLLQDGIGKHFEKKIVVAFMRYLEKEGALFQEESFKKLIYMDKAPKRMSCSIPVSVYINGNLLSGTSVDINAKGIYIAVDFDVQEGSEVELSIAIPDNYTSFWNTKGRVAWVNSNKERRKPSMPVGFGVEFTEAIADIEAMNTLLNSCTQNNFIYALK